MTSRSFDRAADFYDQTRDLPEPIAAGGLDTVLAHLQGKAGAGAQLLEVGAGTGRVSLPLLARGADLTGCDLSARMLARLRAKSAAARLARADATRLPYAAGSFDGLLTIHVLHLVGDWRSALLEFRRVLRPAGRYVNSWNWPRANDIETDLRIYWRSRVAAHGAEWRHPGLQTRQELLDELAVMGATVDEIIAARFTSALSPQMVIDSIAGRVPSDTWDVPEDVFKLTLDELFAWAHDTYGELSRSRIIERSFLVDVVTF